jgi:hypothetical protein
MHDTMTWKEEEEEEKRTRYFVPLSGGVPNGGISKMKKDQSKAHINDTVLSFQRSYL